MSTCEYSHYWQAMRFLGVGPSHQGDKRSMILKNDEKAS